MRIHLQIKFHKGLRNYTHYQSYLFLYLRQFLRGNIILEVIFIFAAGDQTQSFLQVVSVL